jgi:hypothetical protein
MGSMGNPVLAGGVRVNGNAPVAQGSAVPLGTTLAPGVSTGVAVGRPGAVAPGTLAPGVGVAGNTPAPGMAVTTGTAVGSGVTMGGNVVPRAPTPMAVGPAVGTMVGTPTGNPPIIPPPIYRRPPEVPVAPIPVPAAR